MRRALDIVGLIAVALIGCDAGAGKGAADAVDTRPPLVCIANVSYEPLLTYGCVALLYFAICFPISQLARLLERTLR